jgi:signal transduction histidine kinase
MAVAVDVDGTLPDLPAAVEVAAYRIVTEALTNAARHADARRARVSISAGDALRIEVCDDGHGIGDLGVHPSGVGLTSMRRRAEALGGDLAVSSTTGGTTVTATLPLRSS